MTASLLQGLDDILEDAQCVVLLRETEIGEACVDEGDIDLLVSARAMSGLLDTIDTVAASRGLHYRLRRSGPQKIGAELFSADMAHSIKLDLWEQLWQVFSGRSYLTFEDVQDLIEVGDGSLPRLPAVLEASIYIQHLAVKGRDPSQPINAERLSHLALRCADDRELAEVLSSSPLSVRLLPDVVLVAENRLRRICGDGLERRARATRRRTLLHRAERRRLEHRALDVVRACGGRWLW